jgi:lipoate-protein ligase A
MTKIFWETVDSGALSAQENMQIDSDLLADLKTHPRHLLRFYDWKSPSLTYGHFVKPEDLLNLDQIERLGIDIARRPTGGGVICHFTDMTFSILVPKDSPYYTTDTLANYCFVNKKIQKALESFVSDKLELMDSNIQAEGALGRFCMAKPTVLDVVCNGMKVSGGAQRRTRHGFLHQGTISLSPPDWDLLHRIIRSKEVVTEMQRNSHYLPGVNKKELQTAIYSNF